MKTITSRSNPLVKRYRDVASGKDSNLVLLDGPHLVGEARRAGLRIVAVAGSSRGLALPAMRAAANAIEAAGAAVFSVTDDVLRAISPVRSPSGIVALAERPSWVLTQVLAPRPAADSAPHAAPQLVVIAVDVQDPGNVGAIVRAAEAGGATGAIFVGAAADPFGWKALRGSMGSALRLPLTVATVPDVVSAARAAGVRLMATVPRQGRSPSDMALTGPVAFLLGGEGPGLPAELVDAADDRVSIPMRPPVESLNVAVAAALLVYEASRQRRDLQIARETGPHG